MTSAARFVPIWTIDTEKQVQPGPGSHCLLFPRLASRGQYSLANTMATQPRCLTVMLCRALCQGLPTLARLMLKKMLLFSFYRP